jgi:hypothetical protein
MKSHFFISLILVNIISCKNQETDQIGQNSELESPETITLELDLETSYDNAYYEYHEIDNRELLFITNSKLNQIKVYDLEQGKLSHTIEVPNEGSASLGQISSFTLKNKDSLFVFSTFTLSKVLLTNWKGKDFKQLHLQDKPGGNSTLFFNHLSMSANPSIVVNDKMYFFQFPIRNSGPNSFSPLEMNLVYDLKKDSIYTIDIYLPPINKKINIVLTGVYRIVNNREELVYSYSNLDSLYIQKPDLSVFTVYAGTNLISVDPNVDQTTAEGKLNNPSYGPVIYNSYNDLYYRIFYHGAKFNPDISITKQQLLKKGGIIILDSNFEIKTTIEYSNKYAPRNYFTSPKGLFRSLNNEYSNPDMDEDILVFEKVTN